MAYYSITPKQLKRNGHILIGASTALLTVTSGHTYALPLTRTEDVYMLLEEALPDKAATTDKTIKVTYDSTGVGEGRPFGIGVATNDTIDVGATLARNKTYYTVLGPYDSAVVGVEGSTYTSVIKGDSTAAAVKTGTRLEFKLNHITSTGGEMPATATQKHVLKIAAFAIPKP